MSASPAPAAPVPAAFGALLKQHRRASGLTQEALAERAGLSVRGIQDLERGAVRPQRQTAARLVTALSVEGDARVDFVAAAQPAPRRRSTRPPGPPGGARPDGEPSGPGYALPVPLTSFVGRRREVDAVARLLSEAPPAGARLVTLTGPGGSGKTRVALRVAEELRTRRAADVCFVPLEAVSYPGLVPAAMAHALGLREAAAGPGPVAERLREYVRTRELLLVLDNFEHLLDAAPSITHLLAAGDRLRVLATSRAPLRIAGEQEFPLAPLPVPELSQGAAVPGYSPDDPAALERYDAVRLFVERARAVRPDFRLTPAAAGAVAALCAGLDGLPLALELAAARVRVLSPSAMLAQLGERRLPLLAGGRRDAPERQRTLRGAIAWSYDLLSGAQQRLFLRLAVFAGGCSLAAATTVCAEPLPAAELTAGEAGALAAPDVYEMLDGLDGLVTSSLLRQVPDAEDGTRYRMLETVREFGIERLGALGAQGEAEAFRRHAAYFLELAEAGDAGLRGPEQGRWLARLEGEHDNLHGALRWLIEQNEAGPALRLAAALRLFWWWRGHLAAARHFLARALALPAAAGAGRARAAALERAAFFGVQQGDAGAAVMAEEALALQMALGDRPGAAWSCIVLGRVALQRGDLVDAARRYGVALEIHRSVGDQWSTAVALSGLAKTAQARGDYAPARALHQESLALRRQLGDRQGIAEILEDLGQLAQDLGDLAQARAYHTESLAISREMGDRWGEADSLQCLGQVALEQADPADALAKFGTALQIYQEVGDQPGIADALEGLAAALPDDREAARAQQYAGAAAALREALSLPAPTGRQAALARRVERAAGTLDPVARAAAQAVGRATPLEQVLASARDLLGKRPPPP